MSREHSARFERLVQVTRSHIQVFGEVEATNQRFAFWHNVGVTGIGALATILLGVGETAMDPEVSRLVRVFVLFLTGSVTVFAACDQFFKFKTTAQTYQGAVVRLLSLERALERQIEQIELRPDELVRAESEFDAVLSSVEPVRPNTSVFGVGLTRWLVLAAIVLVVIGSIATSLYLVHRSSPCMRQPEK